LTRRTHEIKGNRTNSTKKVVIFEVVRFRARAALTSESTVGVWGVTEVVLTSVRGADDWVEVVEALEELAVRTAECERALPLGAFEDLPRGVAVPSEASEELEEWLIVESCCIDEDAL
jgi:hypothetical protein